MMREAMIGAPVMMMHPRRGTSTCIRARDDGDRAKLERRHEAGRRKGSKREQQREDRRHGKTCRSGSYPHPAHEMPVSPSKVSLSAPQS